MQVGVSMCSPPVLELDCQVSGLTNCVPRSNWMRKLSLEGTRMAKCTCYYWTYFSYYWDYCAFLCSSQAQCTCCRSRNNGYEEQGWPQECQSRLWRLHKGCTLVNLCLISLIIANYWHYLKNYCNYLVTQLENCDWDRYLMWKPVQEAQDLTAITHRQEQPNHPV